MVLFHLHLESRPKNDCPFLVFKYKENRQENQSGFFIYLHLGFFLRVVKGNVFPLIN
jgi:hypothetical protein